MVVKVMLWKKARKSIVEKNKGITEEQKFSSLETTPPFELRGTKVKAKDHFM